MAIKVPQNNLVIEDAKITYRNFAGNEGPFNVKGVRSFALILSTMEEAEALAELGWNVKYSKLREDGSEPNFPAYMPVSIKYHPRLTPPRVKLITKQGTRITSLDEEAVDVIDFADIAKVDMILRPFKWEYNKKEGVKNMLVSIYVTIREDELELKYADIPDALEAREQLAIESSDDVWEDLGEIQERRVITAGF